MGQQMQVCRSCRARLHKNFTCLLVANDTALQEEAEVLLCVLLSIRLYDVDDVYELPTNIILFSTYSDKFLTCLPLT